MPWWMWIALGVVFLVAEVIISADFYLVFFGVSGLIVGLIALMGVDLPTWAQWLTFALISIVALVVYRGRLKAMLSRPDRELTPEIVGETGVATENVASGATGMVELRGSVWKAQNDGEVDLVSGDQFAVLRTDGLTLRVRKLD